MEDYILREINKIALLIEALLMRVGAMKRSGEQAEVYAVSKTELLEQMNLDLDTALDDPELPASLRTKYGFDDQSMERFAELLFDLVAASSDKAEQRRLAHCIGAIYCYLDENKAPASINRYYILKDLKEYIA